VLTGQTRYATSVSLACQPTTRLSSRHRSIHFPCPTRSHVLQYAARPGKKPTTASRAGSSDVPFSTAVEKIVQKGPAAPPNPFSETIRLVHTTSFFSVRCGHGSVGKSSNARRI
jgi:hypothetical protein